MERVLGGSIRSWVNQNRELERPLSNGTGDDGEECSLKRGPFYRCGKRKRGELRCFAFFEMVVSLLKRKRDRVDDITVHRSKALAKPILDLPTTLRLTCYVVVVAVALDNLGALILQRVVTPVYFPLHHRSCHT